MNYIVTFNWTNFFIRTRYTEEVLNHPMTRDLLTFLQKHEVVTIEPDEGQYDDVFDSGEGNAFDQTVEEWEKEAQEASK